MRREDNSGKSFCSEINLKNEKKNLKFKRNTQDKVERIEENEKEVENSQQKAVRLKLKPVMKKK